MRRKILFALSSYWWRVFADEVGQIIIAAVHHAWFFRYTAGLRNNSKDTETRSNVRHITADCQRVRHLASEVILGLLKLEGY